MNTNSSELGVPPIGAFEGRLRSEFKGLYGPDSQLVVQPAAREPQRRSKSQYKFLSADEQRNLVRTVKEVKGSDTAIGRQAERDYVIIETFLNAGLRREELAGLNVGDVRNKMRLWVRPEIAKGSKGRFVPINRHLQNVIRAFIRHKLGARKEAISDEAPLFVSKKGNRIELSTINRLVEKWMLKAGLTTIREGRTVALFSVHSLRHSFAKRMEERGVPIQVIQKLLGHATIQATAIYTGPRDEELSDGVEAATV